VHVASIIYYFSNYIHKKRNQVIRHPADYLNSVLVNLKPNAADNYESSNNPQYIKNRRRAVKEPPSSSESDDGSSIPSDYDDDSEADMLFSQDSENKKGNIEKSIESEIDKTKKMIYDDIIERLTSDYLNKFNEKSMEYEIDKTKKMIYDDIIERLTSDFLNKFNEKSMESEIDKTKKMIYNDIIERLTNSYLSNLNAKESNNGKNKAKKAKLNDVRPAGFLTERQLRNGAWLTDREIVFFLSKIKEYFYTNNIEFQGLRDPTVLTALRTDNLNMRQDNFVEVLFSNNNHWVCVAAGLKIANEDLCLFDSMPRKKIDSQLGTTCSLISALTRLEKGHLIFKIQKVSKQRASFCGYFALANAMALCLKLDPESLIYDEDELRNHFINIIFYNQPIAMFPYTVKQRISKTAYNFLTFEMEDVEYTDRQINKTFKANLHQ